MSQTEPSFKYVNFDLSSRPCCELPHLVSVAYLGEPTIVSIEKDASGLRYNKAAKVMPPTVKLILVPLNKPLCRIECRTLC